MDNGKEPIRNLLSDLNLLDRFLFACAMEDIHTMELVLQIILGRGIKLFPPAQAEKELRTMPWLRSVRLDVFTMDDQGIYNTEVQNKNTGNLLKRSRFYQALMDSETMMPGEVDFNRMPDATLITIAPFDLFGEGRYQYTFRMKCEESEDLWLQDGASRIFLNTRGTNDGEVSEELVELLHYFEHSTAETAAQCRSERVLALHKQISRIKASEEIGVRFMQEWEEKAYARAEGKEEGKEEGKAEGKFEGSMERLRTQVTKKLAKGKTIEEIADELEEDAAVVADVVKELKSAENKSIDDTEKI